MDTFYNQLECAQFTFAFKPPGTLAQIEHPGLVIVHDIGYELSEFFAPLPSEHDLDPMFRDLQTRQYTTQMRHKRQEIIKELGLQMAIRFLLLVESRDPKHGYSPEQWDVIHDTALKLAKDPKIINP